VTRRIVAGESLKTSRGEVVVCIPVYGQHDLVLRCLESRIADAVAGPGGRDYKTRLQELAAAQGVGRPRYVVRDEGPDHAKHFFASVFFGSECYGDGEGGSKKQAEQGAAWVAWSRLQAEAGELGDGDAGAT